MKNQLSEKLKGKRYAYLKHGNVVEEAKQLFAGPGAIKKGAFTYVAQFFGVFKEEQCKLISFSRHEDSWAHANWQTCTINKKWGENNFLGKMVNHWRQAYLTFAYLRQFKPDYIICAAYRAPLLASYIYHKISGAELIHSRHNIVSPSNSIFNKLAAKVDNVVLRRLAAIICHGDYLKKELVDIGVDPTKLKVFRAGYRSFLEAASRCGQEDAPKINGKRVICFTGRVVADKGIFDLLEAVRERIEKDDDLLLFYLGAGSGLEPLREKIKALHLEEKIKCYGWVDHDQLACIINCCDFVVTPSRSVFPEGFPKAAVEPLILGKPVIAPDYGPFSPFIKDGVNGLIFKSDSVSSLREKVLTLLDDSALYEKVKIGAKKTGEELVDPPMTFAEALIETLNHNVSGH